MNRVGFTMGMWELFLTLILVGLAIALLFPVFTGQGNFLMQILHIPTK